MFINRIIKKAAKWIKHQDLIDASVIPELSRIEPFMMGDRLRMIKQYSIGLDIVKRGISGDFVECGVCNGGSAAAFAIAFKQTQKKIWLYDSFEGLPQSGEKDGVEASKHTGQCVGSISKVQECMMLAGLHPEDYIIRKGWFKDSFMQPLPEKISILHIDADWYQSVSLCLETFYDRVEEGGAIVLDDFGHWEGCREAFYEFTQKRNIKPLLERSGHTVAYWFKNRKNNRNFMGQIEIP